MLAAIEQVSLVKQTLDTLKLCGPSSRHCAYDTWTGA